MDENEKDIIFDEQNLKDFWQIILNKLEPQIDGKHLSANDLTDELKAKIDNFDGNLRDAVANIYCIKGGIIFEELPLDPRVGDVYNIGNGFYADNRFVESERGNLYGQGANVVWTEDGWDVLSEYASFISELLPKADVTPISDESILDICHIPEYQCTIGMLTNNGEITYIDRSLQTIEFNEYYNDIKYVYITAIADNGMSTQNIYYYISTSPILSNDMETIDWKRYTNRFDINDAGRYVIYAKIINQLGEVKYGCSNGFILDIIKPIASITVGGKTSSNTPVAFDQVQFIYNYNESKEVSIAAFDEDTDIDSIYYFISSNNFAVADVENLENMPWSYYESPFEIKESEKYVIYAKIVDKANNVLYIMSDGFIIDKEIPNGTIYINDDLEFNSYHTPKIKEYWRSDIEVYVSIKYKLSEVNKVEYYVSSRELSLTALTAVSWKVINTDENEDYIVNLELTSDKDVIIYIKLTDQAGNIGYLNTDMIKYIPIEESSPISFAIGGHVAGSRVPVVAADSLIKYKFSTKIGVIISPLKKNIKEIYYYKSSAETTIVDNVDDLSTLDWILYETNYEIPAHETSNYYIYVKIVYEDDTISYVMSDGFLVDRGMPTGIIYVNGTEFTEGYHHPKSYASIGTDEINCKVVPIEDPDRLAKITEVYYYVSDTEMVYEYTDMPKISSIYWKTTTKEDDGFSFSIPVDKNTANENIIYIKLVADTRGIRYINTDKIRYVEDLTEEDISPIRFFMDDREYNAHHLPDLTLPIHVERVYKYGPCLPASRADRYDTYFINIDKCDDEDIFKSIEELNAIPDEKWVKIEAGYCNDLTSAYSQYAITMTYMKVIDKTGNKVYYANSDLYIIESQLGLSIRDGMEYKFFNDFIPKDSLGFTYYPTALYRTELLRTYDVKTTEYLRKNYDEAFNTEEELLAATGWNTYDFSDFDGNAHNVNLHGNSDMVFYARFTFEDGTCIYKQTDHIICLDSSCEDIDPVKYLVYLTRFRQPVGFEEQEREKYFINRRLSIDHLVSSRTYYLQDNNIMLNAYLPLATEDYIINYIRCLQYEVSEGETTIDRRYCKTWPSGDMLIQGPGPATTQLPFVLNEGVRTVLLLYYEGIYAHSNPVNDGTDKPTHFEYESWDTYVVSDVYVYDPNYVPKIELQLHVTNELEDLDNIYNYYTFIGYDKDRVMAEATGIGVFFTGMVYLNENEIDQYATMEYYVSDQPINYAFLVTIEDWQPNLRLDPGEEDYTKYVYARGIDRFNNIGYANVHITIKKE